MLRSAAPHQFQRCRHIKSICGHMNFYAGSSCKQELMCHIAHMFFFSFPSHESYNLRTPFKYDSRCALLSFVTTNSTPQREVQWMSYLKGVQRLMLMLNFRSFTFEPFPQSSHLCDTDRWKALSIFAAINRSPIVTSGVNLV